MFFNMYSSATRKQMNGLFSENIKYEMRESAAFSGALHRDNIELVSQLFA